MDDLEHLAWLYAIVTASMAVACLALRIIAVCYREICSPIWKYVLRMPYLLVFQLCIMVVFTFLGQAVFLYLYSKYENGRYLPFMGEGSNMGWTIGTTLGWLFVIWPRKVKTLSSLNSPSHPLPP